MTQFQTINPTRGMNVSSGPFASTRYSLAAGCKKCGAGAEQIGPLRTYSFKAPKKGMILTNSGDILVAEALAKSLLAQGFAVFERVETKTGKELAVRQLRAQGTLPPFSSQTTGYLRERPCEDCGRSGYFGTAKAPFRLVYESIPDALAALDVLATWEEFGAAIVREPFEDSVLPRPSLVISERLANALKTLGVKQVGFEPVKLLER